MRVLDLTWLQVGPQATRLLATFGAQVIRIEWRERKAIDFIRYVPPFAPDHANADGGAARAPLRSHGIKGTTIAARYFNNTNPGKYGITLNLNHPKGRELLRRMVRDANVLCENFSPGQMEKWGLGYDDLRKLNPEHHLYTDHRHGKAGIYKDYVSYGPTAQALSGLTYLSGLPEPILPAGWGYSYLDHSPGYFGAFMLMAAIRRQRKTGVGCYIDMSQSETGLMLTGTSILEHQVTGKPTSAMAIGCRTAIGRRMALIDAPATTTGSRSRSSPTSNGARLSRRWDRPNGRAMRNSQPPPRAKQHEDELDAKLTDFTQAMRALRFDESAAGARHRGRGRAEGDPIDSTSIRN